MVRHFLLLWELVVLAVLITSVLILYLGLLLQQAVVAE
jgi:hypothetical protein